MQFALTVKLLINMHDLNNERAEEIRRVPLIYQVGNEFRIVDEAVAVSGVMLKHWHFIYLVERAKELKINLCPICERGESIRVPPPDAVTKEWLHVDDDDNDRLKNYKQALEGSEDDIIKQCVGEDLHGFLRTRPRVLRREALIKFSWLLPVYLGDVGIPTPFRVVQHSRNIREIPERPEELKQMQMPYPRSYADGVYGFTSLCNLDLIGFSLTSRKDVLNCDEEKKKRQRAALEAYIPMLTGAHGASLARALPASKTLEVTVFVSKNAKVSFPAPVHPIYEDYYQLNEKIFRGFAEAFGVDVQAYVYGIKVEKKEITTKGGKFSVTPVEDPVSAIVEAIKYLGLDQQREA